MDSNFVDGTTYARDENSDYVQNAILNSRANPIWNLLRVWQWCNTSDGNYLCNPNANSMKGQTIIELYFWDSISSCAYDEKHLKQVYDAHTMHTHTTNIHTRAHTQFQWRSNETDVSYEHCLSAAYPSPVSKFIFPTNARKTNRFTFVRTMRFD